MEKIILFHGTDHIIEKPQFGKGDFHNDYGQAFYCTKDINAGKEWANRKIKNGVVNKYELDLRGLNVLDLTNKSKYSPLHWISVLMHFRVIDNNFKISHKRELQYLENHYYSEIDISNYDIIIGYRADDSYFEFPLLFIDNQLRVEMLQTIFELGYLGTQYAIVSERAFAHLRFIDSKNAEPIFFDKYHTRVRIASEMFEDIKIRDRYLKGTRILDLVGYEDD